MATTGQYNVNEKWFQGENLKKWIRNIAKINNIKTV